MFVECEWFSFDQIKEDLNIVIGSFVTLNKPLKLGNKSVHVWDTMLLAQAGSKKLVKIGILSGKGFEISVEVYNAMIWEYFF